jgi:deoxyribodipyrimidine photo-lyase
MNQNRVRLLQNGTEKKGPVLYWMSRDQRVQDNWALIFAKQLADEKSAPLIVAFSLVSDFQFATERHFNFLLKGLMQIEKDLAAIRVPFVLLPSEPQSTIPQYIAEHNVSALVSDFDPLKIKRVWKKKLAPNISIPFYEVDAHNIIPALFVSQKLEFSAHTIRSKIHRHLPEFSDGFPVLLPHTFSRSNLYVKNDWDFALNKLPINREIKEVPGIIPGELAAHEQLDKFLDSILPRYNEKRNNPCENGQSGLSPYLHFGQISAQRVAHEVQARFNPDENTEAFLEELIVRRELSDNFCYYNTQYDSVKGFHAWAQATLQAHEKDEREYCYSLKKLETASTHDPLWNAAQNEMVYKGKMHGYLRMYWAKKILEWSESPAIALKHAIYLNDRYQLDGRDPNGYTGCAWSIGGVHDRAWGERPVFGKIRYMNYNGCARKFNIAQYIENNVSPI